jgi:aminoglycoside phosphotransferase (APT) family kinase protein
MSTDKATEVRKGEELDKQRLTDYLKKNLAGFKEPLQIKQFPSGYSNLTYLLQTGSGEEYVLRKPPHGANVRGGHDMGREFNVLKSLEAIYPKVPHPVLFEEDPSLLGGPFYLMQRVHGVILRNKAPEGIHLGQDLMRKISISAVETLAELHNLNISGTPLEKMGKPDGYAERQVHGWVDRYYKAQTDDLAEMDHLADWLKKNVPADSHTSFIHNDFKYDNLVLSPENLREVKAVLDWEMATVGNPFMDLGTTLAYWCEAGDPDALKPFNLTWLPGNLRRIEVVEHYAKMSRVSVPDMLFFYVFGSFKIGVIVQQIYARYKKGLTQDPRFAALVYVLKASATNGVEALDRDGVF